MRAPNMIDLCGQLLCMNHASVSYVYPGRSRAKLCSEHFKKLVEVAEALGLPLDSLDVQALKQEAID